MILTEEVTRIKYIVHCDGCGFNWSWGWSNGNEMYEAHESGTLPNWWLYTRSGKWLCPECAERQGLSIEESVF